MKLSIKPDNIVLELEENNNVLDSALKRNVNLPYGCKDGLCGTCKCKVLSGDFKLDNTYNNRILTDEELEQGYTLLCKTIPQSNLELYIPDILNSYTVKILPAKIINIKKVGKIAIIKMKIPPKQEFKFFAGQYIEIILSETHRSYSIANACLGNDEVEIHVKYHKDGIFSEFVWNELLEGKILRFKGPLGNFKLSKAKDDLIFACTGTGFAPVKSMLEDCVKNGDNRKIHLYWGNREVKDFYLLEELDLLSRKINININLCLSREIQTGFYSGYITNLISKDFAKLDNHEVYACGNLKMIEDVYEICTKSLNLDKNKFYSDVFTPSL
jgi:CDP-4-dehydro-6-deoxyglucose reductase